MTVIARRRIAHIAAVTVACAAMVLQRFSPATSSFYPRCPVFLWLHLYCPGCGGTRALAALLHGRLIEALHWNPMVAISFPFVFLFFALSYRRAIQTGPFYWPAVPDAALQLCLGLIGIFTVLRNVSTL
jgi:hypothetical protein